MILCIFPLSCLYMFMIYVAAGLGGAPLLTFIIIILVSLLLISKLINNFILYLIINIFIFPVGQITIFWLSISMFNKIRRENNAKSNNTSVSYQTETPEYTAIIDKSVI